MARQPDAQKIRARIITSISRLPEAAAVSVGEHLSLEVRKRRFGWFMADHHGDGRIAINCKVPALIAAQLSSSVPQQFHIPTYVGSKGWIGLWLDVPNVDWAQVDACLQGQSGEGAEDAHRQVIQMTVCQAVDPPHTTRLRH